MSKFVSWMEELILAMKVVNIQLEQAFYLMFKTFIGETKRLAGKLWGIFHS